MSGIAIAALISTAAALPAATDGQAPAASTATWERVAQCESGGDWSINTGNGFYGGLQFTRQSWLGAGGGRYARTADRATEQQQIAVAESLLRAQGPGAWPVCGPRAGLSKATGAPATRPPKRLPPVASKPPVAAKPPAVPKPPAASQTPAKPASPTAPSSPATPTTPTSPVTPASPTAPTSPAKPASPTAPASPTTPTTPTSPVTPTAPASPTTPTTPASPASPTAPMTPASPATPTVPTTPTNPTAPAGHSYRVAPGDTLSGIARRLQVTGGWQALYAANQDAIADPDVIRVGVVLHW